MICVYKGTSKAIKRFRSVDRFEQWIDKTFKEQEGLIFHREYGNYFKVMIDGEPTGYSIQY